MFLGLRKSEGVSKEKFLMEFDVSMEDIYNKQLNKLTNEGLIVVGNDFIRLTDYGIDVSNIVLAEFLFD